jgi:hypothetical protein
MSGRQPPAGPVGVTYVHVMPDLPPDELQHDQSPTCWCQPVADERSWDGSAQLLVHRRYVDGPARDPDDDKGWLVVDETK